LRFELVGFAQKSDHLSFILGLYCFFTMKQGGWGRAGNFKNWGPILKRFLRS